MCELFGVSSDRKISLNEPISEFFSHSPEHPHGWGLALFFGNAVSLEKEPVMASDSQYLKHRLRHKLMADSAIAHIRLASVGQVEYPNCHPFVLRDNYNRTWTLAHNGTIFDCPLLSGFIDYQEGSTDSERILMYVIAEVDARQAELGRELLPQERFELLDRIVAELAPKNKLNLLIYDGEYLYVHTNYRDSLYWCSRHSGTVVFCTRPLSLGEWHPVPFTRLLVYHRGRQVYEGKTHGSEYTDNKKDQKYMYAEYAGL